LRCAHEGLAVLLCLSLLGMAMACGSDPVDDTGTQDTGPDQAAAQTQGAGEESLQSVQEIFEVGENVYVRALKVDEEANSLWVGTSVGINEVDLLARTVSNTFTREHGLANEYVFAVGIDHARNKWFGTNGGGVSRYRDGVWKTFFPMHGLADYWVYSFASQSDGTLWIGTWAGVNTVDPRDGSFTLYVKELINEWVYGIAVDSQDRVWFGTEGGVTRFDGSEWHSWTHEDGLGAPNAQGFPASKNTGLGTRRRHDLGVLRGGQATYNPNYVFAVHIGPDDVLWAGTWGGGVTRFDGETWKNFTRADGLAGNIVYSIARDAEGVLWFGTNAGVSRFDGVSWTTYARHQGLKEVDVYAIEVDPTGSIWIGIKGAVVRLAR